MKLKNNILIHEYILNNINFIIILFNFLLIIVIFLCFGLKELKLR